MNRNLILYLTLIMLTITIASISIAQDIDSQPKFQELKSQHFIIKYRRDKKLSEETAKHAEEYYKKIEKNLGLNRYSRFWTWSNRCTIVIFADQNEYQAVTGLPYWSGGGADYQNRVIYTYPSSETFLSSLLPHELTHIIFREYVKNNQNIPLWIDEGIAQYTENDNNSAFDAIIKQAVSRNQQIPLNSLQQIKIITDNSDKAEVALFYAQSRNLIKFMITKYGEIKFGDFLRQLKSGKTVDESLRFAYAGSIDSIGNLEKQWINSLK